MKGKKEKIVFLVGLMIFLTACAGVKDYLMGDPRVTSSTPQTVSQVQAEAWKGQKVRVAVMEFENKTGAYYEATAHGSAVQVVTPGGPPARTVTVRDPIGSGMREQLITALSQTQAFLIIERAYIKDVLSEQDLAQTGRVRRETAPGVGDLVAAEFLIYGAVTEYTPSQASVAAGAGYGALPIPSDPTVSPGNIFLQILRQKALAGYGEQDHVAMDIRLVDARTGVIVNSTSVEAHPKDIGGAFGGMFGEFLIGVGGQYQTPMQKAIRAAIVRAVNWIADQTLRGREAQATPIMTAPVRTGTLQQSLVTVTSSIANIRSGPDTKYDIVDKVSNGMQLAVLDSTPDWFKVRTPSGKEGWIFKELTK